MYSEALTLLAGFLEACPKQVHMWDGKVVTHLASNSNELADFRSGNEHARWRIYERVKYKQIVNGR